MWWDFCQITKIILFCSNITTTIRLFAMKFVSGIFPRKWTWMTSRIFWLHIWGNYIDFNWTSSLVAKLTVCIADVNLLTHLTSEHSHHYTWSFYPEVRLHAESLIWSFESQNEAFHDKVSVHVFSSFCTHCLLPLLFSWNLRRKRVGVFTSCRWDSCRKLIANRNTFIKMISKETQMWNYLIYLGLTTWYCYSSLV